MAIFNSGAAIGSVVAPPLIVWLSLAYGWRTTFIATGALGFIWLALWIALYETPERHRWLSDQERALIREGQESDGEIERAAAPTGQLGVGSTGRKRSPSWRRTTSYAHA